MDYVRTIRDNLPAIEICSTNINSNIFSVFAVLFAFYRYSRYYWIMLELELVNSINGEPNTNRVKKVIFPLFIFCWLGFYLLYVLFGFLFSIVRWFIVGRWSCATEVPQAMHVFSVIVRQNENILLKWYALRFIQLVWKTCAQIHECKRNQPNEQTN